MAKKKQSMTHFDIYRTNTTVHNIVHAQTTSRTSFLGNLKNKVLGAMITLVKTYSTLA